MPRIAYTKNLPQKLRNLRATNRVKISLRHIGSEYHWDQEAGIEFWHVEVFLSPDQTAESLVIAEGSFYRVDLNVCVDLAYELDSISLDLCQIGAAVRDSEERLTEYSIAIGGNSSILIAEDVVVDRFWRGNRLGPALVFFAAETLRADGVFLSPVALGTRISASGMWFTDYEAPRPGPAAQKKVEAAWRRAGFRKLLDKVIWKPSGPNNMDLQLNHFKIVRRMVENVSDERRVKAWLKRRIRRKAALTSKPDPGRSEI